VTDHHDTLPARVEEPLSNPGLSPHAPRPTDVDERAERRAERQVAAFFVLSMVCAILFCVAYFAFEIGETTDTFLGLGSSTAGMGVALGLGLLFIGIGVIQLARKLMGDHEIVELRHAVASSPEDREETLAALKLGVEESGIGRRPLVRNTMLGAMGLLGLPLIVGLRDLYRGELLDAPDLLERTVWKKGTRVVRDVLGTPIKATELEIGDLVNCEPEGLVHVHEPREGVDYLVGAELQAAKSKAAVILTRMEPKDLSFSDRSPENWSVEGIIAYSKICTHVGCPISLKEQQTHHLLCPCHQSTFDLTDGGRVLFGPAARALPQLPLMVDAEGYLVAQSDFLQPVGPSYWERDSE
jgi:ubiquinol-cytochrome c reductase iron-sulfur subunit